MTILPLARSTIELTPNSTDWTQVHLVDGNNRRYLGADTFEVLRKSLIDHLEKPPISQGSIDGHDVSWVLTLSEEHCTLYSYKTASGWMLFWQDANANIIWSGELSHGQFSSWLIELSNNA